MLKLRPRKTIDDYMKLPEETLAELIEGEIFMAPAPSPEHQRIVGRLFLALRHHLDVSHAGEVILSPVDVHLPSGDIVEPDLVFVSSSNAGIVREVIKGTPGLVVEVLSAARPERDLMVKRGLYARNGIPEFWIADPATRTVEVLVLEGAAYAAHGYFEAADALTSPTFAGLMLSLAEIFPSQT